MGTTKWKQKWVLPSFQYSDSYSALIMPKSNRLYKISSAAQFSLAIVIIFFRLSRHNIMQFKHVHHLYLDLNPLTPWLRSHRSALLSEITSRHHPCVNSSSIEPEVTTILNFNIRSFLIHISMTLVWIETLVTTMRSQSSLDALFMNINSLHNPWSRASSNQNGRDVVSNPIIDGTFFRIWNTPISFYDLSTIHLPPQW